jgi:preprotein translocase subunit SecA
MTGTADTEAAELNEIYKLDVSVIPTNKPMIRKDAPDLVYKNEIGKFRAVLADVEESHERGQPVLVGTVSVEKSEVVANLLKSKNLQFNVLNAKQHQREASIVAQAGRKGAITIATNMAGRGTDILLGGNPEAMAKDALAEEKTKLAETAAEAKPADGDGEAYRGSTEVALDEDARYAELLVKFKAQCEAERQEVLEAGGLKIIGTERHESRRVDNQLRGRAGRQGDPGASRFYLSLQDDLLRIFGLDKMSGLMERLGLEEDVPIESPMVTRSIEGAQKKVEGRNFDQRKNVLEYDDVMNQQRKTIYALRRQILEGRYHPEPTEEQAKVGFVPEPVEQSGDWTIESLTPELETELGKLLDAVNERIAKRETDLAAGLPVPDQRPPWRVLRAELWRQYGALLEVRKNYELPRAELLPILVDQVARSLIQQRERLHDLADQRMAGVIQAVLSPEKTEDEWDYDELEDALHEQFNLELAAPQATSDEVAAQVWPAIEKRLGEREQELTRPWLMYFLRDFSLNEIDEQWRDHLKSMDALREGIGLQGYGQKDPKKEYKRIGYDMFSEMMDRVQSNVVNKLFRVQIHKEVEAIPALQGRALHHLQEAGVADKSDADVDAEVQAQVARRRGQAARGRAGGPAGRAADLGEAVKVETVRRERPKVGRNDPCPCGSGKKYKKCHGKDEGDATAAAEPANE